MKIILLRSVERLGKVGDIVEVSDGYARNFLIPHNYGVLATAENIRQLEHRKRRLLAKEAETKQKLQAIAQEISKQSVTIMARANEEGHLFGSVTPKDIAEAFKAEDIHIEPRAILLDSPIKEIGCYEVKVRLHPEIETTAKVWVVRVDEEERLSEPTEEAVHPEDKESKGEERS